MQREAAGSGQRLVRSVLRNASGNIAGPLAGLASAPVLAQAVGVEGRGSVAAVTAPILLTVVIAAFGIPDAVTYFVARSSRTLRGLRRRALLLAAGTSAVAAVVVAALAPTLLIDTSTAVLLVTLALCTVVPGTAVGVLRAHAAGHGRWGLVSAERTIGPVLRLVAFLVLAGVDRLDVLSASVVMTTAPVAAGLLYLVRGTRATEHTVTPPRRRAVLGYGARAWFGTLAGAAVMRLDQVLMVPLSSPAQLGLYAVAVTVSELPLVATTAVREVLLTSDARRRDDAGLARAARLAACCSVVVATTLCASAPAWLPALFGQDFAAALVPTVVLAAAVVVGVPGSVAGAALSARGLPHLRSTSLLLAAALGTVALVALVPSWGATGGAVATLVGNAIGGWTNVAHLVRRSSLRWRDFLLPTRDDGRAVIALLHNRVIHRRGST